MKNEFIMSQLAKNNGLELVLDENTPWLKSLLDEFCDGLSVEDYDQGEEIPSISFEGLVVAAEDDKYHDYATLTGKLKIDFYTLCIKTGTVILDTLETEVEAAFINSSLKEKFKLEEAIDIFLVDREYELYFHEKGKFDIMPVLLEYAYVNKNPYPSLES